MALPDTVEGQRALIAELRSLAQPHALVRRADVRRDQLLDLARRLEVAQRPARPAAVARRAIARHRIAERLDPMLEIKRLLAEETAEI